MGMIKINDLFSEERIKFLDCGSREEALTEMINLSENKVIDVIKFGETVFERENIVSTGLGQGYAIPHVKNEFVPEFFITMGIIKKGVNWDSMDGKDVDVVFLIGGPDGQQNVYLSILSKLSLVIKNSKNKEFFLNADSAKEIIDFFGKY